jgi:hypothetical protein
VKRRLILLSTILVLAGASPALAGVITVVPASQTKVLGNQATVDIVSSGEFVGDFDLNISWNPAIVSLFDIDYGTQLGFSIQNPFAFGAGTVNASEISLEAPLDLMALQPGTTAVLLTLVFDTIALGVSPVTIGVNAIGDENGLGWSSIVSNGGEIKVVATSAPEPSTLLLLASGLGLLLRRHRRVSSKAE